MVAATLWLVLFGVLHVETHMMVFSLFVIAPLIVATVADERRTAILAGAAVALTVGIGLWEGSAGDGIYWTRAAVVCAIGAMAVVVAGVGPPPAGAPARGGAGGAAPPPAPRPPP